MPSLRRCYRSTPATPMLGIVSYNHSTLTGTHRIYTHLSLPFDFSSSPQLREDEREDDHTRLVKHQNTLLDRKGEFPEPK